MAHLFFALMFVFCVFIEPATGELKWTTEDKQTTLVVLVLDRTGSMESSRDQIISGFNEYIEGLKNTEGAEFLLTLLLFDKYGDEHLAIDIPYKAAPLDDVKPLTRETYVPRGLTPLYDAIGHGMQVVEQGSGYDKVIFVIMTDGEENSSKEFTRDKIFTLIDAKKGLGNWTFAFLGADQDAYAASAAIGIGAGNTMSYDSANTKATFGGLTNATSGAALSKDQSSTNFFGGNGDKKGD